MEALYGTDDNKVEDYMHAFIIYVYMKTRKDRSLNCYMCLIFYILIFESQSTRNHSPSIWQVILDVFYKYIQELNWNYVYIRRQKAEKREGGRNVWETGLGLG